jgi:hypothetical protein
MLSGPREAVEDEREAWWHVWGQCRLIFLEGGSGRWSESAAAASEKAAEIGVDQPESGRSYI